MSNISPNSRPDPCQSASENRCKMVSEKWWKTEPAGTHRAGPAGSPDMAKIYQSTNPCDYLMICSITNLIILFDVLLFVLLVRCHVNQKSPGPWVLKGQ